MKIKTSLLFLIIAFSGCSFKKGGATTAKSQLGAMSAKFDWLDSGETQNNFMVKATRSLTQVGANSVASSVVTIPLSIPNPLIIENDALPSIPGDFQFAKGFLQTPTGRIEVPVSVTFIAGKAKFEIDGLKDGFSQESSQTSGLDIVLYSGSSKLFTYSYSLRTPPSLLKFDEVAFGDSSPGTTLPSGFLSPEVNGVRFALVQFIELTNSENLPIQINFPSKLTGTFTQDVTTATYTDLACHGGDFQTGSNAWTDSISTDLYSIPFDQNVLVSLSQTTASENAGTTLSVRIEAGGKVEIAVYAKGEKANGWVTGNACQNTVSTQHVPAGCYIDMSHPVCTEGPDTGHPGGGHQNKNFENQIAKLNFPRDLKDHCAGHLARTFQDIPIGDTRGDSHLHLDTITAKIRYFDIDQLTDEGVREVQFLNADSVVKK